MIENKKLHQDMIYLLGQIDSICYPLISSDLNQAYFDLVDSIRNQYVKILKQTIGYEE